MQSRLVLVSLLLALLSGLPAGADNVYLRNGRSFQGVIADLTDTQVHIHMQTGVLSLPRSQVLRVEESDSAYGGFIQRKEALLRDAGVQAGDWLELARWAKSRGLQQAAREAALESALLDPHLAGLETLLRGYGYVLDKDLDRWIPYSDSMRRRGFVQQNGEWLSPEEYGARQQRDAEMARLQAARDAANAARVAREAELAVAELELRTERLRNTMEAPSIYDYYGGYYGPPIYYGGVVSWGSGWHHGSAGHPGGHPGGRPGGGHQGGGHPGGGPRPGGLGSPLFTHQPGSLIPGTMAPRP